MLFFYDKLQNEIEIPLFLQKKKKNKFNSFHLLPKRIIATLERGLTQFRISVA